MSKSKGNAVDPFDALKKHGADAIRWYFYENSAPWLPNRFHDKAVTEGQRKFMGTIWNTYAFFVLYANIDDFDATKYTLEYDKLPVMDKWILSKLNTLVKTVDNNLANYKITETARALEEFVDELSNWYVRRCRERFWAKGMEQDKINAYMTLYTTLVTLCKTAAPMIPFMTESIYRNLVCSIDKTAPISIHLCDFPEVKEEWIDKELEDNMEDVLNAVVIGRACRNSTNIKNRQPIGKLYIKADWKLNEYFTAIIADELNVKEVKFTTSTDGLTGYNMKPQLRTLGPKYGKLLPKIKEYKVAGVVRKVTCKEKYVINGDGPRVALMDFGAKKNIAKSLNDRGCEVTVYPAYTKAEEILASNPDGIMLSNGPGDPKECVEIIEEIKKLYASNVPIFAICLGHQLMSLATGADTHRLKYGHRGANHPVKDLATGKVYISTQNHGYVVDEATLNPEVAEPAFENVNDKTNEGLSYKGKNIFTVQFHPEACAGPQDTAYLFDRFMDMMKKED